MRFTLLFFTFLISIAHSAANAIPINLTGEIKNHNDIIFIGFSLEEQTFDVKIWSDSFGMGVNFDPIASLWSSDGTRLAEIDDGIGYSDTQTFNDTGMGFDYLDAGRYTLALAAAPNTSISNQLSDGFSFDLQQGIPLSQWFQPFNEPGMGTNWSLWLDGPDTAVVISKVPEPKSLLLLTFGLFLLSKIKRTTSNV